MGRFNPVISIRWNNSRRAGALCGAGAGAVLLCAAVVGQAQTQGSAQANAAADDKGDAVLRVCADPNNMPLSNEQGEGYENKIAEALAKDLGRTTQYTYFPQRMGFVRNTLRQKDPQTQEYKCDVIIGVPNKYELTATTRPYMRSTYALVYAWREDLGSLQTAADVLKLPPKTRQGLRIGVFGRSPGADWMLRNDLMEHAVFYTPQSGDPAESPAHIIEEDLAAGRIDAAIVWGPIAGLLVRKHAASPSWRAVPFMPQPDIRFDYEISMGVRFGEKEWQNTLDQWIGAHQSKVHEILTSYRIPLLDADGKLIAGLQAPADQVRTGSVPR
jgi:quinoprotein dehydrogenase-associated probable ABC transporter substrate-binding protein